MWPRYREAGRKEKGRLLDEVCRVTGYHRKYAVRCPNGPPPDSRPRRRRLRNMVFDQINNAPGLLQPLLQWGRLQDLGAAAGDPNPTLTMNSTAYDFMPERTYAWNVGLQQKLAHAIVFDIAYCRLLIEGQHQHRIHQRGNLVPYNGFGTINAVRAPRTMQMVTRLTF
jgi:hypothetical protein